MAIFSPLKGLRSKDIWIALFIVLVVTLFTTIVLAMSVMETRSNSLKAVRKYDFEFMGNLVSSNAQEGDVSIAFKRVSEAFVTERFKVPFFPVVLMGKGSCFSNGHANALTLCNTLQSFDPCQKVTCEVGIVAGQENAEQTLLTYRINSDYVLAAKDGLNTSPLAYIKTPFIYLDKSFSKIGEVTELLISKILVLLGVTLFSWYVLKMLRNESRKREELELLSNDLRQKMSTLKAELTSKEEVMVRSEEEKNQVFTELNGLRCRYYDLEQDLLSSKAESDTALALKRNELDSLKQDIIDKDTERLSSVLEYKELHEQYAQLKNELATQESETKSLGLSFEEQVELKQKELEDERSSHRKLLNQLKDIWHESSDFKRKRKAEMNFIEQEAVFTLTQAFLALEQQINKLLDGEISKEESFAKKIKYVSDRGYVSVEERNKLNKFRDARNRWMHELIHPSQDLIGELMAYLKESNTTLSMW